MGIESQVMSSAVGTSPDTERAELLRNVVQGGYCVGCGACAALQGSGLSMSINQIGQFEPVIDGPAEVHGLQKVCPFSNRSSNETEIARRLFGNGCHWNDKLGYYRSCYAGYIAEGSFRSDGSSGGFGKWIGHELQRLNLVDAVVQVAATHGSEGGLHYSYVITHDLESTRTASKSAYYPVELSEVVREMKATPGRYAVVGVPCFIKAIRLLMASDPVLEARIRFTVGLVCGHLKSKFYGDMIAWQEGVEPDELQAVDFRKKYPGSTAKQKGMEFEYVRNGQQHRAGDIVQNYFGTNYALGLFKYNACEYCDDVVAETADIVVGDAWLPQYVPDGQGTNILIVRNEELQAVIDAAHREGRISLDVLTEELVIQSQAGGFRHRRDGLKYRLHLKDAQGSWRPEKRVEPATHHLSKAEVNKFRMRLALVHESPAAYLEAKRRDSFAYFRRRISRVVADYETGDIDRKWPQRQAMRTLRIGKRMARGIFRRLRGVGRG